MAPSDRAAYERRRAAHLHDARAALDDHVARLGWTRERIEQHRSERLRGLIAHAQERSPFHAERMRSLDPASATVADLARLPPMSKRDAQDHWDAIVIAPGLDRAGAERRLSTETWFSYTPSGEQIFSSGGSSGVRGVYVWSWATLVTYIGLAWRTQLHEERALAPDSSPGRLAVLEAGEPPHASTPLFDFPLTDRMESVVIAAGAPFDEVLAAVAHADPTHLVGYASVVGHLARAQLAGELDIHPVRVSTNSEPLSTEDRAAIVEAWSAPVHNLWGSTEIGVHAVACGDGEGLHICEDEVVLERVDESGQPVGPDEPAARTLATGLANWAFPFIRYDLGDQVTLLSGSCACGSAFARVAAIEGRRDDDFRYGTRTIPASAFRHVLGADAAIEEYQVRQTPDGADVVVVGSPDVTAVEATLARSLKRYGLERPAVRVSEVDRLERNAATGKLKRFVALSP